MAAGRSAADTIAVYGATGYTGRLIAAELRRRGVDFVLAGRSAAKLEVVAEDVGGAPTQAVALDDPRGLRELLEPCAAVIACAGPFQLHGEPVLAAAVDSSTHYIDTTGEQPFMRKVFDSYGDRAADAGVVAVTAMGFDYVPGDMIAALTAEGMDTLDELVLAYHAAGFGGSRGTALSAIGMMAGGDVEWREGALEPASQSVSRGDFDFPEPIGRQRMVRYPAGEHITVPRHVDTRRVRTMLNASMVMPHPRLAVAAPIAMPIAQLAVRSPLRRLLEAGVARLPEGPAPEQRRASRFCIVCEANRGAERAGGTITGRDVYGLTARTTVQAALECAQPGYERSGALAPSEAFDPRRFLEGLADFGVSYEVMPA
ncbi:MAG: saccharopine dehydrogenase NADP-binding domain-containing protein [bacterium]